MAEEIQRILIKYEADAKELRKDLDGVKKQLRDTDKEAGRSGKAITATFKSVAAGIAAAFSVQQVVQFGKELFELQKTAQGVRTAFNDAFSPETLTRLRRATAGTVSDLELMRTALKAREFSIPEDTLAKGLEFARIQANKLGEDVGFLTQSIVDGLGRKSPLILDNLGISAADLSAKVKETGDFYEAAAIIIEQKLGDSGAIGTIETLQDRQARLAAEAENFRVALSDRLVPAFDTLVGITGVLIGSLNDLIPVQSQEIKALEQQRDTLNLLVAEVTNSAEGTDERRRAIEALQRQYPNFLKNLDDERLGNKDLVEQLALANEEYTRRLALLEAGEQLAAKQARVSRLLADQQRDLAEASIESNKAIAEFGLNIDDSLTGVDRVTAVQDALRELFNTTDGAEAAFRRIANARGFLGPVTDDLAKAQDDLNRETEVYNEILKNLNISLTGRPEGGDGGGGGGGGAVGAVSSLAEELEMLAEIVAFNELFDAPAEFAQTIQIEALRARDAIAELDKAIVENGRERNAQLDEDIAAYQAFAAEASATNAQLSLDTASAVGTIFGALVETAGASGELAKAFLVFERLIAIAQIAINLQQEISGLAANPSLLLLPPGAREGVLATQIAAAKTRAGVAAATILATTIPELAFAKGTSDAPGGMALVGEEGPEIMHVPKGARIFTADASKREKSLIDAINEGRVSAFIEDTYVKPALSTFADNLAKSAPWQAYDDFYLRQAVKANKTVRLDKTTIRALRPTAPPRFH